MKNSNNTQTNLISAAIKIVGLTKLAKELNVSYQAIRKWEAKARLPRTEWTGETEYAKKIEEVSNGQVSKSALLSMNIMPESVSDC